jgi:hypothetical protein
LDCSFRIWFLSASYTLFILKQENRANRPTISSIIFSSLVGDMTNLPQTSRVHPVEEHEHLLRNSDQPFAQENIVTTVGAQPSSPGHSTALTNVAHSIDEAPESNNLSLERRDMQDSATFNAQTRSDDGEISEIPSRRSTTRASLRSTSVATRSEASETGQQALPTCTQNNGITSARTPTSCALAR